MISVDNFHDANNSCVTTEINLSLHGSLGTETWYYKNRRIECGTAIHMPACWHYDGIRQSAMSRNWEARKTVFDQWQVDHSTILANPEPNRWPTNLISNLHKLWS